MQTASLADWLAAELAKIIDSPQQRAHEQELLLSYFVGAEHDSQKEQALRTAIDQRVQKRLPLAYILGETRFCGLRFFVRAESSESTDSQSYQSYVPRSETEQLVRRAVEYCQSHDVKTIVDIATGSGCIPVSVKKFYPQAEVTAVDISPDALAVAKRNSLENEAPVQFLQGSWFEPVMGQQFDLILCNPPYVPMGEKSELAPESQYEPQQALFPSEPPVELYQQLLQSAKACMKTNGAYLFEIGFGQFQSETFDIVRYAESLGLSASIEKDQDGVDRFLMGRHLN